MKIIQRQRRKKKDTVGGVNPLKYPPKKLRVPRGEIQPGQHVNQEKTKKLKTEAHPQRKRYGDDDNGRWCLRTKVKKAFYRLLFLSEV